MRKLTFLLGLTIVLSACASSPTIQPQINSLTVANRPHLALKTIERYREKQYGERNRQLYLMDYGLLLQLTGRYKDSIRKLEEAKSVYDQLYTVSVSNQLTTWLINDNRAPYRGEDFERVMINVIQALNFIKLGQYQEALVEARDVDNRLKLINRQYKEGQKNVYNEDAFARMLMGILYEVNGTSQSINDAFISNRKALKVYEDLYEENFETGVPQILQENLLTTAQFMGDAEFKKYQKLFPEVGLISLKEKQKKAEVYLIHYDGMSPIKYQAFIPIPLPDGHLTKLAFPRYERRVYDLDPGLFKAVGNYNSIETITEKGEDISLIAMKALDQRKLRVIAKAVLRSGGKAVLAKVQTDYIEERRGKNTARAFKYLTSLYNYYSEQADLRSWQTLPAQIRIARLLLEPGEYEFSLNQKDLGTRTLTAGQKEFFIVRTNN